LQRADEINVDMIFYSLLIDTAALEEDLDKLKEYTPWLVSESGRHDHQLFQAVALRAQAVINRLGRNFKPARNQLQDAVSAFETLETNWQLGRTYMELGSLARAQNDQGSAGQHYQTAMDFFESLSAIPDLQRARQALDSLIS